MLFQLFIFLHNVNYPSSKKNISSLILCVLSTEPGIQKLFTFLYFVISQSNFDVNHSLRKCWWHFSCGMYYVKVLQINTFMNGIRFSHSLVACTIWDTTVGGLTIRHFSTYEKMKLCRLTCVSELAYVHNRLKVRFTLLHAMKAQRGG